MQNSMHVLSGLCRQPPKLLRLDRVCDGFPDMKMQVRQEMLGLLLYLHGSFLKLTHGEGAVLLLGTLEVGESRQQREETHIWSLERLWGPFGSPPALGLEGICTAQLCRAGSLTTWGRQTLEPQRPHEVKHRVS